MNEPAQFHMTSVWPPIILDVEASGFGKDGYPIEVGYVTPEGKTWCSLIQPEPEWTYWSPEAESLHHISRASIESLGKSVSFVASWLNQSLHGQTVFSDGWSNDYTWVYLLFDKADMTPSFQIKSIRELLDERQANLWNEAYQAIGLQHRGQRHRASQDARLIQLTLISLSNHHL